MSTNAETRIGSLIRVASELIELMNREIDALRGMRIAEVEGLQEGKAALSAAYEECVRDLAADPGALAAVDQVMREEFAKVAGRFQRVLADNERALYAARFARDRVLKAVVEAVTEDRAAFNGYASNGARAGRERRSPAWSSAITLDTRL